MTMSNIGESLFVNIISFFCGFLFNGLWSHRQTIWQTFCRVQSNVASKFKKKETEEQKESRQYWETINSDDPNIWKPGNQG
jgi:hypothetical protein